MDVAIPIYETIEDTCNYVKDHCWNGKEKFHYSPKLLTTSLIGLRQQYETLAAEYEECT